jgi:hypothetical protein
MLTTTQKLIFRALYYLRAGTAITCEDYWQQLERSGLLEKQIDLEEGRTELSGTLHVHDNHVSLTEIGKAQYAWLERSLAERHEEYRNMRVLSPAATYALCENEKRGAHIPYLTLTCPPGFESWHTVH